MLTSFFRPVADVLPTFVPGLDGKTVTFIPTASMKEPYGFVNRMAKWTLRRLGLVVDEIDVAITPHDAIADAIRNNDLIYVTGGNTFYLLQSLRQSGADELIVNAVNQGKPYIGESAGAVVTSPDIEYVQHMDSKEPAPHLSNYGGLHLVDFHVVPHYEGDFLGRQATTIVESYSDTLNMVTIRDDQALLIEGGQMGVVER